ncbi:MAG TPA: hypothetical protein VGD45_14890 [Steroidobacter sp.]|uniref:hypothetical protein n=1 Tax=Steroidobacter sp. TaxID=1978227 RepID=UPI002ED95B0C
MGTPRNEGEGNKTADRNYREATKEFVESERGQREIQNAGNVSPSEEKDIRRAEEQAKQRAKDHDPAETTRGESGPEASESRPGKSGSSRDSRSAH